jgi:hypothetical protein
MHNQESMVLFRRNSRKLFFALNAGTYVMNVLQNFPVKSFNGRKKFIATTTSCIGGKNFLVVGGLCLVLALLFGICTFVYTQIRNKKS